MPILIFFHSLAWYRYANGKSEEFLGEIPVCHDPEKVSLCAFLVLLKGGNVIMELWK